MCEGGGLTLARVESETMNLGQGCSWENRFQGKERSWERHLGQVSFFFFFFGGSIFLKRFIYLWLHWVFIATQGLSLAAASRGNSHGSPWAPHLGVFSCFGAQALEFRLNSCETPPMGSSQTRNQAHLPCIARWILNHWTTREVLDFY